MKTMAYNKPVETVETHQIHQIHRFRIAAGKAVETVETSIGFHRSTAHAASPVKMKVF